MDRPTRLPHIHMKQRSITRSGEEGGFPGLLRKAARIAVPAGAY
jgi:hypothetical protein